MSDFDERKKVCVNTCLNCKHCGEYEVVYEDIQVRSRELFCMLGVSREDREYISDLEPLNFDEPSHDPRFIEIMKIKDGNSLACGYSMTEPDSCCQFYE